METPVIEKFTPRNGRHAEPVLKPRTIRISIIAIYVIGVLLRTIQFAGRSSLWFDELTNALNVQARSFFELATKPLDFNQVAPPGFLMLEKLAITILGDSDQAFRLFPWLFSLAALPLFHSIAKRFLKDIYLLVAFFFFAICGSQLFYSGEGKPYSGDVTICLFMVLTSFRLLEEKMKTRNAIFLAITGCLLITTSLPAVPLGLMLMGLCGFAHLNHRLESPTSSILIVIIGWFIGCVLGYLYAMHVITNTVQDAMTRYWSEGFAPMRGSLHLIGWIISTVFEQFNFFLTSWTYLEYPAIRGIGLGILLFVIPGLIYLGRVTLFRTLAVMSPFVLALLLAITKTLPFEGRVAIYATWPFLIVGLGGMQYLAHSLRKFVDPRLWRVIAVALPIPFVLVMIFTPTERPPFHEQPSQLVLKAMKSKMKPGDVIYVYNKAKLAMRFYGPREGFTDYQVSGTFDFVDPYYRELDKLKGKPRVWFFYTQWTKKQPFPDGIKKYLNKIGKQIDVIPDPYGGVEELEAAAYLYDISDSTRFK
ncbi:MAG: hypothetical protein ABW174_13375 [Flavitalea sp.]